MPLPNYDELSVGALAHQVRQLEPAEVERLLDYEHEHANRAVVVDVLTRRLNELRAGARPSGGGRDLRSRPPGPHGGSPVTPSTSASPRYPPPHGVPNQPGHPKGNRP
jgi:hypothetical protein